MNAIQTFNNKQFGCINALTLDDEPWFIAKEVCDILGIGTNHLRENGRGLDNDEVANLPNWENSGLPPLIISEAGFYKLVMRSRKPEAKSFQRWVTHDVLPSLRREGAYVVSDGTEDEEVLMARGLIAAQRAIERKDKQIASLMRETDDMRPKVLFADAVGTSDDTCSVGELAKLLTQAGFKVGQNRLFTILRNRDYLGKNGSHHNIARQKYVEQGLFRIRESASVHADGGVSLHRTTRITGKGQRYFIDKFIYQGKPTDTDSQLRLAMQ